MQILIVNDDGWSEGVVALANYFKSRGDEVTAVLPDRNRSGTGASITFTRPIKITRQSSLIVPNLWYCDGTPVDCVNVGMKLVKPDLVVSGINLGLNLGEDARYSGTINAAVEANPNGVQSIAFSFDGNNDDIVAHRKEIEEAIETVMNCPLKMFTSVNIPKEPEGTKFTKLSKTAHLTSMTFTRGENFDNYTEGVNSQNAGPVKFQKFHGSGEMELEYQWTPIYLPAEDTDAQAIQENLVSITTLDGLNYA